MSGGQLSGGLNCPRSNCPGEQLSEEGEAKLYWGQLLREGGKYPGGNYRGRTYPRGNFQRGNYPGGNCSRTFKETPYKLIKILFCKILSDRFEKDRGSCIYL